MRVFLKFCLPKRVIRLIRGFVFLLIVVSSGSVAGGRRLLFSVIFCDFFFIFSYCFSSCVTAHAIELDVCFRKGDVESRR